jgi:uncharacterized protein (TIGR02246 family)
MAIDPAKFKSIAADYARAWGSGSAEAVASFYAADGRISINRGEPSVGRDAVAGMAAGFFSEFPDLVVHCDELRVAGDHAVFAWTLEGHHAETKNHVKLSGWEEWDLDGDMKVKSSLGWFDAADYERQVAGG